MGGRGLLYQRDDIDEDEKKLILSKGKSCARAYARVGHECLSQRDHARLFQERQHAGGIGQHFVNNKYSAKIPTKLSTTRSPSRLTRSS